MISQPVIFAMLMTLAAVMMPLLGWGRLLVVTQQREGEMRQRRLEAEMRRQQEREAIFAALMPAPEASDKGKKK